MSRRLTKPMMKEALTAAGIPFAGNATVAQLLPLYEQIPAARRRENERDAESNDDEDNSADEGEGASVNEHENEVSVHDNDDENVSVHNQNQNDANDHDALDAELDRLRKQRELLMLKKQVQRLQREMDVDQIDAIATPPRTRRPDFRDIEHAIVKFTGDDPMQDVIEFVHSFEERIELVGGDDSFKLLGLRRSLDGAARLLLQSTEALTYDGLKTALIREFGDQLTSADIEKMLRARKWKPNEETMHFFVLHMQQLANRMGRTRLTEVQLIDVIVGNLNISAANEALLCSANTIDELKSRMNRYASHLQTTVARSAVPSGTISAPNTAARSRTHNAMRPMPTAADAHDVVIKCYNCSKDGHYQSACPYAKRPSDSCFKCWKTGHKATVCPGPRKILTPSAQSAAAQRQSAPAFDDEAMCQQFEATEELNAAMGALNTVSVAFTNCSLQCTEFIELVSLFDTGSPHSFVRRSHVPNDATDVARTVNIHGLSGHQLEVLGALDANIKFRNKILAIRLFVIPDAASVLPLILGRDFLNKFNIHLKQIKLMYSKSKLLRLKAGMPSQGRRRNSCVLNPNSAE